MSLFAHLRVIIILLFTAFVFHPLFAEGDLPMPPQPTVSPATPAPQTATVAPAVPAPKTAAVTPTVLQQGSIAKTTTV